MSEEIKAPSFPESIEKGQLVVWRVQPGEPVTRGAIVAEIETDKVVFEVPAQSEGVLTEHLVAVNDEVQGGQTIARIEVDSARKSGESKETTDPEGSPSEISPSGLEFSRVLKKR